MSVKLLTEHHLEFLSLKGGCSGSSESALVKMPHCWKSHVMAHVSSYTDLQITVRLLLAQITDISSVKMIEKFESGQFFFSNNNSPFGRNSCCIFDG